MLFQSTHPLRGATGGTDMLDEAEIHFNPRTPCGVRLQRRLPGIVARIFQSTHPLRGATPVGRVRHSKGRYFNPRTPCGVRRGNGNGFGNRGGFQSTHPLRGATGKRPAAIFNRVISIHAPLAGCDWCSLGKSRSSSYFNPRTPCGVRPGNIRGKDAQGNFNPRTPCGVRLLPSPKESRRRQFQSTHPLRGATTCQVSWI